MFLGPLPAECCFGPWWLPGAWSANTLRFATIVTSVSSISMHARYLFFVHLRASISTHAACTAAQVPARSTQSGCQPAPTRELASKAIPMSRLALKAFLAALLLVALTVSPSAGKIAGRCCIPAQYIHSMHLPGASARLAEPRPHRCTVFCS